MQFSIPFSETISDLTTNGHQVFHVYLNGFLHSKTRYSVLHDLHAKLRTLFPEQLHALDASFPPRKLLILSSAEIESRRDKLETYLQTVSQSVDIVTSPEFNQFLLKQQILTFPFKDTKQVLPITLPDLSVVKLDVNTTDSCPAVLFKLADKIGFPKDYLFAYKLMLIEIQEKSILFFKFFLPCESPLLCLHSATQQNSDSKYAIIFRKLLSSVDIESQILKYSKASALIAAEIRQDITYNITNSKDSKNFPKAKLLQLSDCELFASTHKLRYCGYIKFQLCISNFPDEKTYVVPRFGRYELCLEYNDCNGSRVCANFKVSRIKCWSVGETTNAALFKKFMYRFELAFEYYLSPDKVYWVKLMTNDAIMMSLVIQQMVDELSLVCPPSQNVILDEQDVQVEDVKSDDESCSEPAVELRHLHSQYLPHDANQSASNNQMHSSPAERSQPPSGPRISVAKHLDKQNATFELANLDRDL